MCGFYTSPGMPRGERAFSFSKARLRAYSSWPNSFLLSVFFLRLADLVRKWHMGRDAVSVYSLFFCVAASSVNILRGVQVLYGLSL
jgi:hypothetical protein